MRGSGLLLAACLPVAAMLTGCAGTGDSSTARPAVTASPSNSTRPAYEVSKYAFPSLTVAPGTTVRVSDGDDEPHTVTADDGSFDTGSFEKTHPGTFTAPRKPGRYAISCKVHPSMHGTIVVR